MRLLNPLGRLPGGWRYEQFDANSKLLHKWSGDFDPWEMFLAKVMNFRVANQLSRPNIDLVEQDVEEYLAREFGGDPRYFTSDPSQKKTSFRARFQSRSLAKLADISRKLLTGEEIIREWFGDGLKPVSQEVAQNRADICLGSNGGVPCPHNNPGWKPVEAIAEIIRSWSSKKNDMTLAVTGEDKLHSCDVCLCDLKTKVFVPMETISERTPQAMFDKFASEAPSNCWMRQQKPPTPA